MKLLTTVVYILITLLPTQPLNAGSFPHDRCRVGYAKAGSRLCYTAVFQGAASFANAMANCQQQKGRVADYGDFRYIINNTGSDILNYTVGFWLGTHTADDRALFINGNNVSNFDGETSRFDSRRYICAHDLDVYDPYLD